MYNTMKKMIPQGGYKLADMQAKIKKMYLYGDLDEAQLDELMAMAAAGVDPRAEAPELRGMLESLAARVAALESHLGLADSGAEEGDFPAWKPWDGLSADYAEGAVVRHGGKLWRSVFAGQNVWEPGAVGTEGLWVIHAE